MTKKNIIAKVLNKLNTEWYHGRSTKSDSFDLKYTGKGKDEDGPGFYFTKNKRGASQYAYPNGVTLTVSLDSPRLLKGDATYEETRKLIEDAPDYEESIAEYGSGLEEVVKLIMKQGSRKDVFEQVWYDFYHSKDKTPEYLKNLIKMGYDGHTGTKMHNIVVIYNPSVIKVIKKEDYVKES